MPLMTVTATQGGSGTNGTLLDVDVLAPSAAPGAGAAPVGSSSVTTPELAITPAANGSVIFGVVIEAGAPASAFTPASGTTFTTDVRDTTDGIDQGAFRSSATTAGTPVTVGATLPVTSAGDIVIALAEILSAGVSDPSKPAGVQTTTLTASTAQFSPPPGSVLVAMASGNSAGTPGTLAITDSLGLTWTLRTPVTGVANVGVWTATVPPAGGAAPPLPPQMFPPLSQVFGPNPPFSVPARQVPPPVLLTNTAEGGTSGVTVTPGNSGGASGSAFDGVSIGTGATLAADSTRSAHGALSYKVATASTATGAGATWAASLGTQTQVWFRLYLYFTANPANQHRLLEMFYGSGSAAGGVVLSTGGLLTTVNASGAGVSTFTDTIPLNQWFRIEGSITGSATAGQISLSLFKTMDAAAADETHSSAATQNTGGSLTSCMLGCGGFTVANVGPFWMDDVGISTAGPLGPSGAAVPAPPPVLLPVTRSAPAGRARLGARALCAAGIAVAAILPQPVFQAARTVVPALRPVRARAGAQGRPGTGNPGPFVNRLQVTTQPHPPVPASPPPRRARLGPESRPAGGNAGTVNRLPVAAPACLPFLPHPRPARARLGARSRPAGGVQGLVNRLPVLPPAPRPFIPHPQPQRALWRGITGPGNHGAASPPKLPPQIRRGPGARVLWRGITGPSNRPVTAAPGQLTQPRRGPGARAAARGVAGLRNSAVTAAPAQLTQPRRGPGARAIWRGSAVPPAPVVTPATAPGWHPQPRRSAPARAAWRGNAAATAAVTAAPRQIRQPSRLVPSRAVWRGSPPGLVNQPPGRFAPRLLPPWVVRRPQRAIARGILGPPNQTITFAAVAWKPQPRRGPGARAVVRGVSGPRNSAVTPAPRQATQPRRPPGARALWHGITGSSNRPVTAAPGEAADPRRPPGARAIWRGIRGQANRPVTPAPPQLTQPRRIPGARAIWRGLAAPFSPAPQAGPRPAPRIQRPGPARAIWRGILRPANAAPAVTAPRQSPPRIQPRPPARARLGPLGRSGGGVTGTISPAPPGRQRPPQGRPAPARAVLGSRGQAAGGVTGPPATAGPGITPAGTTWVTTAETSYTATRRVILTRGKPVTIRVPANS